jgi:hypothetical protein
MLKDAAASAGALPPDVVYAWIEAVAAEFSFAIEMPIVDPYVDSLLASAFYRRIADRIRAADVVIWVCMPGDTSGAAESTIASISGKRQLILVAPQYRLPRMIEGQPGVEAIALADNEIRVKQIIRAFLAENWRDVDEKSTAAGSG